MARLSAGVVVFIALLMAPAAHATFPGSNGILAWSIGDAIYGVDPGSTTQRMIVDVPGGADNAPSWSADGQRIAFQHDDGSQPGYQGSIWIANADGTGAVQITSGPTDRQPTWSPDGERLAYVVGQPLVNQEIYIVDADGSNATQLTFNPGTDHTPSWSPDGDKIALMRNFGDGEQVWTMNPDGAEQVFLAPGLAPDWSPYGDELVIVGRYPETGQLRRVSSDGSETYPLGVTGGGPSFSPDGTRIAFEGVHCCPEHADVFTTEYLGSAPQTAAAPSFKSSPAWQPIPTPIPSTYVRPKHASPIRVSLVPAFHQCESPDRQHGPPLAFGSCSSPAQTTNTTTIGANSTGFARYRALIGNPVTPADEADIAVQVDLTDVRLAATGADYAFTLELVMLGSITERDVPGRAVTTTVTSLSAGSFLWPLRVIVPCQADPDPDVGAHCHVSTTLDAVTPGAVVEGRRAVWEPDRVLVNDGGDDADASTPFNNEPLATQGLFIP